MDKEKVTKDDRSSNTTNTMTVSVVDADQTTKGTFKKFSIKAESSTTTDQQHQHQPSSIRLDFLSAVELKVFKNFVDNYKATGELRRDDAIALNFIFGSTIQQVFEMIEEDHINIRQSPLTRRVLIEVCGKSGDIYWIPPGHSFCQCMAYVHGKKEYCKHVLAAHLYLAITPRSDYKPISDDELNKIYKECLEDPSTQSAKK